MVWKKSGKQFNKPLCFTFLVFMAILWLLPFAVAAEESPELQYIYFDLSAGNVVITGNSYEGYRYDGQSAPQQIKGTLSSGWGYYVYQSNGDTNTGIIDGVFVRPAVTANRVTYEGQSWGNYITDHPKGKTDGNGEGAKSGSESVKTVIKAWEAATNNSGRVATNNSIKFTGNVGNIEVVIDNIWSKHQPTGQGRTHGSIGYATYGTSYQNNSITLKLRGDNRVANIYYSTAANGLNDTEFRDKSNRLIFDNYRNEEDATLTVANNSTNYGGQWWNAAIGSSDSADACYGLVFNGGIIYAGTTANDDCTAIGGGGNGAATITINGGKITAVSSTSGSAIGGGIGKTAQGGSANITINDGMVYAYNFGYGRDHTGKSYNTILSSAIGGGSSSSASGCKYAVVTINGGTVYAQSVGGTAIGGGSSTNSNGGTATVTINGGTVEAKSISGKLYDMKDKQVETIQSGAAIGGGTGLKVGGYASLTVNETKPEEFPTKLITGSIGGGGFTASAGTIGAANVTITGGQVQGQIIMAGKDSTFDMSGGVIDNSGKTVDYMFLQADGGAIYMDAPNGVTTITGGTIQKCTAVNGGAVYMTAGTFTLSGGEITDCTATGNGGAVYMTAGTFTLSGGTIKKCTAANNGGGVYIGGGQVTVTSGKLTQNNAQNGGGAYVNAATEDDGVFISGGEIAGNIAVLNGGGVAVNNGAYKMTGGAVDKNTVTSGRGGGIYVASSGVDVLVEIRSGSVSGNKAGISGGAVAVVGQNDGQETITVTIGVNKPHYDGNGTEIICDHDYDEGDPIVEACPVLKENYASQTGGGIYITGGDKTILNTYCLEESDSTAADGKALSNFMMVEGGTVVISTADENYKGDGCGKIAINSTIHVFAGNMDLYGSMSNPLILGAITVDVTEERGSYEDHRTSDGKYYKLQYFENFLTPGAEKPTGRYTVFQIKHGDAHEILPALYKHDGYVIDGWWTDEMGNVAGSIEYLINKAYTFTDESDEKPGDLTLYAKWLPVGYYVYFDVGTTDTYRGEMETVRYNYDTENTLPVNAFFRPGWLFVGWDYDGDGNAKLLEDMATVKNLTTERDITLVAIWTICTHEEEMFNYSVAENGLVRSCYCEKCTQTATLIAEDTVFVDGNQTRYQAELKVITDARNGVQPNTWDLTPTYTGKKYNGNAFSNEEFLIGAGNYTVSITDGGKTAKVSFEIKKADREGPAKPEYVSNETNQQIDKGIIKIKDPDDTTGCVLRYKVVWHDNAGKVHTAEADLQNAIENGFELTTNYTNYYVYVRYEEDDNHNASEWVRADSVLFYKGNVYIHISCEKGIDYTTQAEESQSGLVITVNPQDGYYLFNTSITDDHEDTNIIEQEKRKTYFIAMGESLDNPSSPVNIYVKIAGVKKKVTVSGTLTEGEDFGTLKGNTAVITRDSAYTAYFELKNYDVYTNPKLIFSTALPKNTTIILLDKTTGTPVYWSHTLSSAATEIPLKTFVQMGTADKSFELPANAEALVLKYQIIVDFSDSEGCTGTTLTTCFAAERSDDAITKGAPAFPDNSLVTELKNVATSSQVVSDLIDSMQKNVRIALLNVTEGAVASKWNGRCGALVLTPKATLPADARIEAVDQTGMKTLHYRNADGKYVISLPDAQDVTLRLTLLSDLFPDERMVYTFQTELICSNSLAGKAPINGTSLAGIETLTFVKETEPADFSMKIDGDKSVYCMGDTVKLNVNCENLPEHTALVIRLLNKDTSENAANIYIDTGWKQQKDTVLGENEVPLGQNLTGSCCIVLELRDVMGNVIVSVPYYFVIKA